MAAGAVVTVGECRAALHGIRRIRLRGRPGYLGSGDVGEGERIGCSELEREESRRTVFRLWRDHHRRGSKEPEPRPPTNRYDHVLIVLKAEGDRDRVDGRP